MSRELRKMINEVSTFCSLEYSKRAKCRAKKISKLIKNILVLLFFLFYLRKYAKFYKLSEKMDLKLKISPFGLA